MRMTRRRIRGAFITAGILVVAMSADVQYAMGADKTRLTLRNSPYGRVLFANGYAQYVFTADSRATSHCYGRCARAWPPLAARGRILAGDGVDRGKLGVTTRAGGRRQLTYAGQPLYGYVHDPRGEVYCQDVEEFGGIWYAVLGSGAPATSS